MHIQKNAFKKEAFPLYSYFLYFHVDNFICMKECQEYSYLHGKLFKTGCLNFFSLRKCIDTGRMLQKMQWSLTFYKTKQFDLQTRLYLFYMTTYCVIRNIPVTLYTSIKVTKTCYSLMPAYVMIGILSFFGSITIIYGI